MTGYGMFNLENEIEYTTNKNKRGLNKSGK